MGMKLVQSISFLDHILSAESLVDVWERDYVETAFVKPIQISFIWLKIILS
jgi:hypothetical protein